MGRNSNSGLGCGSSINSQISSTQYEYRDKIEIISEHQKDVNKAEHIFGDKNLDKHNLKDILAGNDNDKVKVYKEIKNNIQNYIDRNKIEDGVILDKIEYKGHIITFKGIIKNGKYEPGTYYITKEDYNNEKRRNSK